MNCILKDIDVVEKSIFFQRTFTYLIIKMENVLIHFHTTTFPCFSN
ncbi:hypothetical protein MtrunA17_Chr8g0368631 [Medicago truncatula]|uniref:Uncharacterized protein n=1 Tax=Medicago truncatula TaxID=3880 RepID=A0A396GKM3_MEDTR|nr:hypothetical protein MtrunA17_Chr8g0368631 [Medicago truncatula]